MDVNVNAPRAQWAALFEVLSVTLLGLALAMLAPRLLGWQFDHPLATLDRVPESWLPAAWAMAKVLLVQYSGQLLLAAMFLLARRELHRRRLGLVIRGPQPYERPAALIGLALLAACVLFPLVRGLMELGVRFDLAPQGPVWRQVLLEAPIGWDFMVFMAVFSYGLVPVLEELFYRGYLQGRLQQVLPPGTAVLITATLFTLMHSQYHGLGWYDIASIATLFAMAVTLGVLYQRTGSLLPPILLHALINLPMGTPLLLVAMAVALIALVVLRRRVRAAMRDLLASLKSPGATPDRAFSLPNTIAMLLATAAFALLVQLHQMLALGLAVLMLVAAVGMQAREAARRPASAPRYW